MTIHSRSGRRLPIKGMLRMPRRLLAPNRLGYRGASLLMYGLIFFVEGLPLLLGIEHIQPRDEPGSIGIAIWAGGFVAAGVTGCVAAFKRNPALDKYGFRALFAVGTAWVMFTFAFQIANIWLSRLPTVGWVSIIINTALMIKIWIDSGWNEPTEPLGLSEKRQL